MPKLCKGGCKLETFHISGYERTKKINSSEMDTERTLRLQQMRDNQLLRLGVHIAKQKFRSSEKVTECPNRMRPLLRGNHALDL